MLNVTQPHVDVSPSGAAVLRRCFETSQPRFKKERDIVAVLSAYSSVPSVLAGTEALALMPSRMLSALPPGSLRQIEIDFELPSYELCIWWHPRTNASPLMRWVRTRLIALASKTTGNP